MRHFASEPWIVSRDCCLALRAARKRLEFGVVSSHKRDAAPVRRILNSPAFHSGLGGPIRDEAHALVAQLDRAMDF